MSDPTDIRLHKSFERAAGAYINRTARWQKQGSLTVADLSARGDLTLVTDSQEVSEVKRNIGKKAYGFSAFFIKVGDGDYDEVFGIRNSVPWMGERVWRII